MGLSSTITSASCAYRHRPTNVAQLRWNEPGDGGGSGVAAGLGIAFRAKPAVAAAARCRLSHADLTGVLYAQGYRREEIVPG